MIYLTIKNNNNKIITTEKGTKIYIKIHFSEQINSSLLFNLYLLSSEQFEKLFKFKEKF